MHLLIAAVMVSSGKKGEPAVTQHVNFRRSHCTHCPLQKHQAEAPTEHCWWGNRIQISML